MAAPPVGCGLDQVAAGLPRGVWTLLSATLGLIGGLVSSFGLYWWRQRRRRQSTREAFKQELEIPGDAISELAERGPDEDFELWHTQVPTTLYDRQQHRIDLLSPNEVRHLVAYYSNARIVRSKLNEEPPPDELFDEQLDVLENRRQKALDALED
jgi:hypothetical protein